MNPFCVGFENPAPRTTAPLSLAAVSVEEVIRHEYERWKFGERPTVTVDYTDETGEPRQGVFELAPTLLEEVAP